MAMNKQLFSSIVGIAIVLFHVAILAWLLSIFGFPDGTGPVHATEVAIPVTAAYALTVVKWIIDTQGHITTDKTVGIPFIIVVIILGLSLMGGLVWGVWQYRYGPGRNDAAPNLNQVFLLMETGIGGMFGLLMNDMFGGSPEA